MTYIISLLPLLRGWSYAPKDIDVAEVVTTKKEIFRATEEKGWILWIGALINNKNAAMRATLDAYYTGDATPYDLYVTGLTVPNPSGFWIGVYNDIIDTYCINFAPSNPLGYGRSLVIELTPPVGETVILAKYAHLLVRIDDEFVFRKSLQELGIPKIPLV